MTAETVRIKKKWITAQFNVCHPVLCRSQMPVEKMGHSCVIDCLKTHWHERETERLQRCFLCWHLQIWVCSNKQEEKVLLQTPPLGRALIVPGSTQWIWARGWPCMHTSAGDGVLKEQCLHSPSCPPSSLVYLRVCDVLILKKKRPSFGSCSTVHCFFSERKNSFLTPARDQLSLCSEEWRLISPVTF